MHLTDRHFSAGFKMILTIDRRAHRHACLAGGPRSHCVNERMTLEAAMSLATWVRPLYLPRSPIFLVHYVCHDESFVIYCARDEGRSEQLGMKLEDVINSGQRIRALVAGAAGRTCMHGYAPNEERPIVLQLGVKKSTTNEDADWCPGKLLVGPAVASSS
jgi:hypothetical protein